MLLLLSSVTVVVRDDDDDGDGGGSFAENERVLLLLRAEAGFCHPCCSSFWLREDFCSFLVRMVGSVVESTIPLCKCYALDYNVGVFSLSLFLSCSVQQALLA